METAYDVARWFLSKNSMTHKKVQKLCYYAQAWHCALYNEKLFPEEIEAWVHGPVIPSLYPIFADYKWEEIPKRTCEHTFSTKSLSILEAVYNTYGNFSGYQLESLTHSEVPWISARGDLMPWENGTTPISFDDMKDYYEKKFKEAQND